MFIHAYEILFGIVENVSGESKSFAISVKSLYLYLLTSLFVFVHVG